MGRFVSVAVGLPVALIAAITLIETDTMEKGVFVVGPILSGVTTFVLVPRKHRADGGAFVLASISVTAALVVTFFGTLIWLFQYIPE